MNLGSVPGGLGASALDPLGLNTTESGGVAPGGGKTATLLTILLNPWTSGIAAANAPKLKKAEGKAAREMAAFHAAEEARVRAEAQAESDRVFRFNDAVAQIQLARSSLARKHRMVMEPFNRVQVAYSQIAGLPQDYAIQAATAKTNADALLDAALVDSLPTTAEQALAIRARIESYEAAMDSSVANALDAATRSEQAVATLRELRMREALAEQARTYAVQEQERGALMEFFIRLAGGGQGRAA